MIDMCNGADIEPVITISYHSTPEDLADLVEYCWGNDTTTWGKQRLADGHPEPYRVKIFEVGNEERPPNWVQEVAAMEARAQLLGIKDMQFMYPGQHVWGHRALPALI
jgi:alpha-L-arabinofuranosidase